MKGNPTSFSYISVDDAITGNWQNAVYDLASYSGQTIAVISLLFETGFPNYDMKIGSIGVYNGEILAPTAPSNLTIIDKLEEEINVATIRTSWNHSSSEYDHYIVYYKRPDGSRMVLGTTVNNAYFIAGALRENSETEGIIEVETVGKTSINSDPVSITFNWNSASPPEVASDPNPANLSNYVNLDLLLEWREGARTLTNDIYFGTTNPPEFVSNTGENFYQLQDLDENTTYYWRIDEINDTGTATGEVWSFNSRFTAATPLDRTDNAGAIITARGENSGEEKEKAF